MSFILDALKKSETERQQQAGAEFSAVPSSTSAPRPLRWLWLLGFLLLVNLAVLLGILMRPDTPPATTAVIDAPGVDMTLPAAAAPEPTADAPASFAEQVAEARRNRPPATAALEAATSEAVAQPRVPVRTAAPVTLPTIDELRLDGSLRLPELHLDIHVYSEVPDERFIFINMVKHREQSRLAEGPVVREITADGVILEYQERTFLLPRD